MIPIQKGILKRTVDHIKAVDGISLHIRKGNSLGIVGESGSGKTTLGLALLRLVKSEGEIEFGKIFLNILNQMLFRGSNAVGYKIMPIMLSNILFNSQLKQEFMYLEFLTL